MLAARAWQMAREVPQHFGECEGCGLDHEAIIESIAAALLACAQETDRLWRDHHDEKHTCVWTPEEAQSCEEAQS